MFKKLIAIIVVAVALGIAGYVTLSGQKTTALPTQQTTQENVSVRMKWFLAGTMTPWFAAQEQGYFKKLGLNVAINAGGPDNNSVKLVAAGSDQFGVAGADEILLARAKGIPVVAIAVIFKKSPVCFIAKKGRGLDKPTAWNGKTIEVAYGGNEELLYRALLRKYGVKAGKEVPYTFNLIPFIEDKVDVSVAYCMDQVVTLRRKNIDIDIVSPGDSGILPYGDVVFTTEKLLKEKPKLVENFLLGLKQGLAFSMQKPSEAVDALIKFAPSLKKENEADVWSAAIPFVIGEGTVDKVLMMASSRWSQTESFLVEGGAIKSDGLKGLAYVDGLVK